MPTGNNNCRKSMCVTTSQFETSVKITFAQSTHRTFQKQTSSILARGERAYQPCLVPRPHYSVQLKCFGSRGPRENLRPKQKSSKVRQKWDSSMAVVCKTSLSPFTVKNTPLKDTDEKEKFKRTLTGSFLLVDKGRFFFAKLSFEELKIHEIFIAANWSAWPVLKHHRQWNQAAKFLKNLQVHSVLYSQPFLNGNICFCKYFILDILYTLRLS